MQFAGPIEQEIYELEKAGWKMWGGRSTVWQSPSGALFIGPHGAYLRMMQYPQLNVRKEKKPVAIRPETNMPLA